MRTPVRFVHSSIRAALCLVTLFASVAGAQVRVGKDSATRLTRLGRDLAYGTAEGLAFAGVAQWNNSPPEWGHGWRGYEKRAASNLGEFYVQELTTEGLAAAMNRPLDYTRCTCKTLLGRAEWAAWGAVADQLPDGAHVLAVPRITGAYLGSFAQTFWLPPQHRSRTRVTLLNGTTSLAIGALINFYHELKR
jgi:hypothetical protein